MLDSKVRTSPSQRSSTGTNSQVAWSVCFALLGLVLLLGILLNTSPLPSSAEEGGTPYPSDIPLLNAPTPTPLAVSDTRLVAGAPLEVDSVENTISVSPSAENDNLSVSDSTGSPVLAKQDTSPGSHAPKGSTLVDNVKVIAHDDRVNMTIGEPTYYRYSVANSGEELLKVELTTTNSDREWQSSIDWLDIPIHVGNLVTLQPFEKIEIRVRVTAPADAYKGASNTTLLIATVIAPT